MKILLTGGAGYIGSTTTQHLLNAGHEVAVLDNLSHGYRQAVPEGVDFIEGDIGDQEVLKKVLVNKFDALMHFAAFIEAGESMQKPEMYFENNVKKSLVLFDEVIRAGVKQVVFSSTAAVYKSKDELIVETDLIGPANVYGQTKRMMEEMLYWFSKTKEVKVGILRYFNAAGATLLANPPDRGEAHVPETHLIPNILQVALKQKEVLIMNGDNYDTPDGTCIRDYIHVDDLAVAHLLTMDALTADGFSYNVFNLGNGKGFSNKQVIEMARKVTGEEIPVEVGPRRDGDATRLVANSDKARKVLNWQPKHEDLETIVSSAWEWHKSHPDGYI